MRPLNAAAVAALQSGKSVRSVLVEMDLSSPLFLNTSGLDLMLNGSTYYGAKGMGEISDVADTASEVANLKFTLNGVSEELIALALTEPIQGKAVRIKLAIFDPVSYQILDIQMIWAGKLDTMLLNTGGGQGSIDVTAENAGITLVRPGNILYTNEEQQLEHPGDLAFQYLDDQIDQQIIWPAASYGRK